MRLTRISGFLVLDAISLAKSATLDPIKPPMCFVFALREWEIIEDFTFTTDMLIKKDEDILKYFLD